MQVKKAITYLAIVLAFAQRATAEEVITKSGFTTGTSFESLPLGEFAANRDDAGGESGSNYWESVSQDGVVPGAYVRAYGSGAAYPYATTERNNLFKGKANRQYLALDLESSLDRRILLCTNGVGEIEKKHIELRQLADGIYADALVQLTPCVSAPAADGTDKVVVWLREADSGDGTVTNLVVTAGRFAGGYDSVERHDYVIAEPTVAAGAWCRLTIRMIGDITGKQGVSGGKAAAFAVYVDGKPAKGDASYGIGSGLDAEAILPEARVLISERRLFPCLSLPGYVGAVEVSRFAFDGQGAVDDVLATTERPKHVVSDNIFTLRWDAGVAALTCVVSNAAAVVTNEIDVTALPRFRDFTLGTETNALVTVTDVAYDAAHGYTNGVWHAENGCTVTNETFCYCGGSANPVGFVASTRDVIGVGTNAETGCAMTFAEAKALARTKGVRAVIELQSDMVITVGKQGGGYNDSGRFSVAAGDDVVLDLCGHTLQGANGNPTVEQTGGKLRIMDSSDAQTGRILPPAANAANIAVRSASSSGKYPELNIEAGWYDGYVVITNTRPGIALGTCVISGGSFTNAYNVTDNFYLSQYVTNTLYFGLTSDNYWTTATNGFVWCGRGATTRWDNPKNWQVGEVPQEGDLAIFPRLAGGGCWKVDFGAGVATKRMWIDADVDMAGTNEFSDVTVVAGKGRLVGSGTVKFTGRLPGALTEGGAGTEIRLGEGWKGTVRIAGITKAQPLADVFGWGNAASKVEFAGVRGYLSDRSNHALPYGLILTDDGATPAWRNDTGYTGSTVSFPTLEGAGTFLSPSNTREIMQVFQFLNVEAFTGKFDLGGKRLLLGTGAAAQKSSAGHFTFADAVTVRSGLEWKGVSAHFGALLNVYGEYDQTLMTFTGAAPDVSGVEVVLTDSTGGQTKGRLAISGTAVVISAAPFKISGKSVEAMDVASVVKDGSVIEVPAGSALSIVGNDVVVNGRRVSTVAEYYKVTPVSGSATSYAVSFDKEEAAPTLASFTVGSSGGKAVVQVTNAKPGLWYGLQSISSLAGDWEANGTAWQQASGETVEFSPDVGDAAGFYRVIMTDKNPNGGEE